MKTKNLLTLLALVSLMIFQTSCTKDDEKVSPYANMKGSYTGDIAITGDKTLAGTTTVTVAVDGNNVTASFTYGDYPISIALNVTEVQTDKDILYQISQQDIMVSGNQVSLVGKDLAPSVHGTYSYTNKTLAFSFTYASATEDLVFYFVGDMN